MYVFVMFYIKSHLILLVHLVPLQPFSAPLHSHVVYLLENRKDIRAGEIQLHFQEHNCIHYFQIKPTHRSYLLRPSKY